MDSQAHEYFEKRINYLAHTTVTSARALLERIEKLESNLTQLRTEINDILKEVYKTKGGKTK